MCVSSVASLGTGQRTVPIMESKNLGTFAGEAVKFNDDVILGREDNLDPAMLEELAKNSPFPTVKEAAMMAQGVKFSRTNTAASSNENMDEDDVDGAEPYVAPPPGHAHSTPPPPSVEPLFPLTDDGHITSKLTVHDATILAYMYICTYGNNVSYEV